MEPANLAGVARALNRFTRRQDQRWITVEDVILRRSNAFDGQGVNTKLPRLVVSSSTLARIRDALLDSSTAAGGALSTNKVARI